MQSENQPQRYQIPTHLGTPDTLDLPLFGITVSLTMRQGVCFLLGGSLVFQIWEQSSGLVGSAGFFAHDVAPLLLGFVTYVIAIQALRGRYLEAWALVLASTLSHPKVFVWRSVIGENMALSPDEPDEKIPPRRERDEEEEQ